MRARAQQSCGWVEVGGGGVGVGGMGGVGVGSETPTYVNIRQGRGGKRGGTNKQTLLKLVSQYSSVGREGYISRVALQ